MKKKISKSDFIRQHPNMTAGAVVSEAKKQGISFSENAVYSVRSNDKKIARKKSLAGVAPDVSDDRAAFAFLSAAQELGYAKSARLLASWVENLRKSTRPS